MSVVNFAVTVDIAAEVIFVVVMNVVNFVVTFVDTACQLKVVVCICIMLLLLVLILRIMCMIDIVFNLAVGGIILHVDSGCLLTR